MAIDLTAQAEAIFPAKDMTMTDVTDYLDTAKQAYQVHKEDALGKALETYLIPTLSSINGRAIIDKRTGEIFHALVAQGGLFPHGQRLGNGQFGVVYKVTLGDIEFARKRPVNPARDKDPAKKKKQIKSTFENERRALWGIKSSRVVRIFGVDNKGSILMTYASGGDLRDSMPGLTVEKVKQFVQDALTALGDLGDTTHLDVKPDNFFVDEKHYLLGDFGFSGEEIAGSFHYMAPEISCKTNEKKAKADLWSLGITIIELVTGSLFFSNETLLHIIRTNIKPDQPEIDTLFAKHIPNAKTLDPTGAIMAIAKKLLIVNLEQRANPEHLLAEFREFFHGSRIQRIVGIPFSADQFECFKERPSTPATLGLPFTADKFDVFAKQPPQPVGLLAMGADGEIIPAPVGGDFLPEWMGEWRFTDDLISLIQKLPPEKVDLTPNSLLIDNDQIFVTWKSSVRRRKYNEINYCPPEHIDSTENTREGLLWQLGLVLFYVYTGEDFFFLDTYLEKAQSPQALTLFIHFRLDIFSDSVPKEVLGRLLTLDPMKRAL